MPKFLNFFSERKIKKKKFLRPDPRRRYIQKKMERFTPATVFLHHNLMFLSQLLISVIGLTFLGIMMILQPQNSTVYQTLLSAVLFSWLPSPVSQITMPPEATQSPPMSPVVSQRMSIRQSPRPASVTASPS